MSVPLETGEEVSVCLLHAWDLQARPRVVFVDCRSRMTMVESH